MQAAATSAVLVLSVIAVLVVVLALVLYVRKLRSYFSGGEPDGADAGDAHAVRARRHAGRTRRRR
jgi:hypothetical protein